MSEEKKQLRVVVGLDLDEEFCQLIAELEPRLEVVRDHRLYHPAQVVADWAGDPNHVRTPEEQAEFDALIDSADALFGIPDVDSKALARTVAANPNLKWVHGTAAGAGAQVKAADLSEEDLERVIFTTSAGVHAAPLAEFAVFGVMAGAKTLPRLLTQQSEREWTQRWQMKQISEMTVLVAGTGAIGMAVAERLQALGARVWGTVREGEEIPELDKAVSLEDLPSVMGDVDALVVTLPGTEFTEGAVNRAVFEAAKPGLIVANVGRGTVIDEEALVDALNSGQVGFAALDVFAVEPLPEDSPLWSHPNVLVSPHTAGLNDSEPELIARMFAENATRYLDNAPMLKVVDTKEFY